MEDGEIAEQADPSYNKCYIRQVNALQRMDRLSDAQKTLARALRRKDLENDSGLVDKLVEILTDGKGMPGDVDSFEQWLKGLGDICDAVEGEWKRRCDSEQSRRRFT